MATWHKIQINLHGLHVFGESIKIIEIQGTTFEIFGSFKNPKKNVPPFFSSLFFSRFTVIPTLRSANFGRQKKVPWRCSRDGRDAPLGDVELFVEAQKLLLLMPLGCEIGTSSCTFWRNSQRPKFQSTEKRQVEEDTGRHECKGEIFHEIKNPDSKLAGE